MHQYDVVFLDAGGARVGDVEQDVVVFEHGGDFPAVSAGEGEDAHVAFVGGFNRFDDVAGIAGGGDAQQDIAWAAECADLFAEDVFEAVVVADGGEGGGVGGEGDCGQFHAFFFKTAGQFGGEVLRVGRRAAVAADEDFAVVHQAFDQHHGSFGRRFGQHFDGLPFGGDAFFEMGAYAFLKGGHNFYPVMFCSQTGGFPPSIKTASKRQSVRPLRCCCR